MAKVRRNIIMSGLSGSLGRDHYARLMRDGRTIISTKPDFSNRQFSEGQLAQQSRVKQAAAYAKVASKTNPIYAQKAKGTSRNAYNLALRDWLRPPVVYRIQWDNGQVRVRAWDDVMVTGVTVSILDDAGQQVEQGEAVLTRQVLGWHYQAASRGRILVEARDLAGNVARQEFTPPSASFCIWKKAPRVRIMGELR